ncbi:hypothetical protein [uncultured Thermomonospora sp.]|uniref:hypothetical protein n=1 Tax=uncultured Thermomonospora sp. TaxID=671175 RepID=UPI00259BDA33|nr:hypothetical protein [uncultured Thermomonospora sp.]
MSDTSQPQSAELAALRGEVMTSLARIEGDVRLVLQQIETAVRRLDDHADALRRLDERTDAIERTAVPRAELDKRLAEMRAETAEQARRRLTAIGLILTAVSIGASTLTAVLITP